MTTPQTNTELVEAAKEDVLAKARTYASARQGFPSDGFQDRIEDAGWELAQAIRAYDALQSNPDNIQEGGK